MFKTLKLRLFKTIILPVVLYECETWSPTIRKHIDWECLRRGCWGEYFERSEISDRRIEKAA
jgi:hypothetical protein